MSLHDADPNTRLIIRPDENMSNRRAARSIVCTIQLIAHPVDLVMPIILPIILPRTHPIIRALDDLFSLSVGRPSPTFHLIIRPTDNPTVLPLICPIIHPIDDPLNLTVRRPSPTLSDPAIRPIIHPTDDPFIQLVGRPSPTNRPIIYLTDGPFIQTVGQPSPILSHPAIQSDGSLIPIITALPWNRASNRINQNQLKSTVSAIIRLTMQVHPSQPEPNRPPDLTINSLESSEEGYSTAMSDWPALLQTEKVTFIFQHIPGLAFKPPAGLGPKITKDPPPNRSFHTWPAD